MNDDKWFDIIDQIEDKFGIKERTKEEVAEGDDVGNFVPATIESIIFDGPMGVMKLERYTRPVILDKKMHYNKTQASGARVEYTFSETEKTHKMKTYKLDPASGEYEEINFF